MKKVVLAMSLLLTSGVFFTSCREEQSEVEQAADETGDAIEETGEEIEDEVDGM